MSALPKPARRPRGPGKAASPAKTGKVAKAPKAAGKAVKSGKSAKADIAQEAAVQVANSLGSMVRRARKLGERTLDEVARDAGLSISYLSQIERDLLVPSVATVRRIAGALGIPAGSLVFSRESRSPNKLVAVMRKGERKNISFPQSNIDYELLTPDLRRRASVMRILAKPGAESGPALTHEGEDVAVVLKGTLSFEIGEVWHDIGVGDSIYFNSELPHRWSNRGKVAAEAIWISTPPSF